MDMLLNQMIGQIQDYLKKDCSVLCLSASFSILWKRSNISGISFSAISVRLSSKLKPQDLTGNCYQCNRFDGEYNEKYEINNGDVLISWSASLGIYIWKGEKALLNQHIFKVVFNKKMVI